MIRFDCDYTEGAHPKIIQALSETNMEQTCGYGLDEHCEHARALIKAACGAPESEVHFLVGGTQANTTIISAALRPYQGVLSADTGHINAHETGAIEATGHKVLALPNTNGKITAAQVLKAWEDHIHDASYEHLVQPGMVYISFPTESGTLYSKKELSELSQAAHQCGLPLFIDGARLGYGLVSAANDLTLEEIAQLADVFYIGATKVGALFGEAVVIQNKAIQRDFRYMIKRHGGMLAKGRLLGIQFETLFTDNLYFDIAKNAVDLAMKLKQAFQERNIALYADSYTNQQFPILTNRVLDKLKESYAFSVWEKIDAEHTAVRFCTSWATQKENVDALIHDLDVLLK